MMTVFLATLPPGVFLRAVMEVRPYTSSFEEAARLARARLLLQHSGPMAKVEEPKKGQATVAFLQPRPTVALHDDTETMPAAVRSRRLTWRQPS